MNFFDLKDYYHTNFNLLNTGKWSLTELDSMMFWEREIYVNLLAEYNRRVQNINQETKIRTQYG